MLNKSELLKGGIIGVSSLFTMIGGLMFLNGYEVNDYKKLLIGLVITLIGVIGLPLLREILKRGGYDISASK